MSSTGPIDAGPSGADRRRYVRQPILLDAMISIQGRKPLPCVVRDFCVAGVFVALSPEYLHDITKQTKATLHFALIVEGNQRNYQLGLTIFRLVGNGLGCGFDAPDPAVVALLQSLADASNPAVPDSPESFKETQSGFRREFLQIKDQLAALCDERMKILVHDFLRVADEKLFIAARDAGSNLEETRYLDGQTEFKKRRADIEREVPELTRKAVQIINSPIKKTSESTEESEGLSELSLIDKDEFEEFLTVSELVSELEPKFKSEIFELEKRFGYLAKRQLDAHSNPVGPEVICNIFADTLKNLQSDRTAINEIYSGLRDTLEAGLGRFYESINVFLVQHDVLPVIEKDKPGFKHEKPRRRRTPEQEEREATLPPQDLSVTLGGLGATKPPVDRHSSSRSRSSVQPAPPLAPLQPDLGLPGNVTPVPDSGQGTGGPLAGGAQQVTAPTESFGQQVAAHTVPGQVAPAQINPGSVVPGEVAPAQVAAGQVAAGQVAAGQVAAGQVTPGQFAGAGPANFDATFGGLVGAPAVYATPSLQQAYSTAQTQLALRRDLNQQLAGAGGIPAPVGVAYPEGQVVNGLTSVQQSLAAEEEPGILGGSSIKDRILESIKAAGGGEGHIGQAQADAIEVIANLFESLISDAYLTDGAKNNLARLQAPVHKVALMDNDFFEATNHPVRQVLNRVALVDDSLDENGVAQNERISALIAQVNQEFADDVSIFNPIVNELDEILRDQRSRYQENIEGVVQASIEQQKILQDRRSKDLSATDTSSLKKQLPPEWNKWLDRVRALAVGDRFVMNANTPNPFPVSLVWIGEDNEPFVLVDQKGHKVSTLTMQQVAMYLRRGTLKMLDPNAASAVDRALFGMVNKMHGEVEEQVTRDELTHFLTRKSFVQAIDSNLPENKKKEQAAALCQISIDNLKEINERDGVEVGDNLLESIASTLTSSLGNKAITYGRLSGSELAVYWHKGGVVSAQKKLQQCLDDMLEIDIGEGEKLELSVAAGLVSVDDHLTPAKDLLNVVTEACQSAKDTPDKNIYIAGSENKYKEKLEQMVSYVGKAIERERLVFLVQKVHSLGEEAQMPAAHVVVSAEDRNGRIIPPALFEQALEKSEQAFEVDTWVIKKSLEWIRDDEKILENYSAVIVPLSLAAVRRDDLANTVITELMETAVPPGRIAFEIADKNVVSNLTEVTDMMRTLTEFGCRFILDEFGSGQDNYDYLKELPADFVTIQSDFIREAAVNQKDFTMAKSINELAHFMGKRTLAKQERGEEIQETLKELGIDFIFDRSRSSRVAQTNV